MDFSIRAIATISMRFANQLPINFMTLTLPAQFPMQKINTYPKPPTSDRMRKGTVALDMQGWVSEMQSGRPRCMARSSMHLENRTWHGILSQYGLHLGNPPVPVEPGFHYLQQYCTVPSPTIYHFTILLFYHDPLRLHVGQRPVWLTHLCLLTPEQATKFASRKPTCAC